MALASYGTPRHLDLLRELITVNPDGGFHIGPVDFGSLAKRRRADEEMTEAHADLAASVQIRLEEVILDLARWLHDAAGAPRTIALAGGVALNCVANARLAAEGPFRRVWVQPAAGDAGTAMGAALYTSNQMGDRIEPMGTAALGREWSDHELHRQLQRARVPFERPADVAAAAAEDVASNGLVAWFQGRSEWGPRALCHRSLLANPSRPENLDRLNDIKSREQF